MNSDKIKELAAKIPIIPILLGWAVYIGYDYYSFMSDSDSPFQQRKAQLEKQRSDVTMLEGKIKQISEFMKGIEAKKVQLRRMAQELESMKSTITENLDVPDFMKTTVTEARRVGLTILSIKPLEPVKKEEYIEQPFECAFRGVYIQLVVFLERLASMQKVVRVENFQMHPITNPSGRFVELEGTLQIKAYRYLGSKADELGKEAIAPPPGNPANSQGGSQ